ncbi:MAG: hypothetical protein WBZ24_10970 [Anaerolineales bacterium]
MKSQLMVFPARSRTDNTPSGYAEAIFDYLNRSGSPEAARVRDLVEQLFAKLPLSARNEILPRLRSGDDLQHLSAFFELYLHSVLRSLKYKVTLHPTVKGTSRKPDFLVRRVFSRSFYVEATVASHMSEQDLAAERREHVVYDALNRMTSPDFWLGLEIEGAPESPPPGSVLRRRLRQWMEGIDWESLRSRYEGGDIRSLPVFEFEHDGWALRIRPIPKPANMRGQPGIRPIGVQSRSFRLSNAKKSIRVAVTDKANAYGKLRKPLVVAVNSYGIHTDKEDVLEALYGSAQVVLEGHGRPKPILRTANDGAWIGPEGIRNTRVAAVLVLGSLSEWSIAARAPTLFINPFARYQLRGPILRLPRVVVEGTEFVEKEGIGPQEIFGIKPPWPE